MYVLLIPTEREWPQNKGFATDNPVDLHAGGTLKREARYPKLRSRSEVFFQCSNSESILLVMDSFVQDSGSSAQKKLVAHPAPTPITLME